jgi:arabinofuranosyltransferase
MSSKEKNLPNPKIFVYTAIIIVFSFITYKAWVADDVYLTIRSVDNFVNGYGLRWNILERVQIYTHPLWMFLLSAFYYVIRNPMITFFSLSLSVSLITLYIFGTYFTNSLTKIIIGFLPLLLSKAFVEYSTSGLENPLTHLLLVIFAIIFFQEKSFSYKKIFTLFLIAALATFNRQDTVLLFFPALVYVLSKKRDIKSILYASAGLLPLFFWETFSIIYYGFPFPNTAYAKLATGIEKTLILEQGLRFYLDSLLNDPITLVVIFSTFIATFFNRERKEVLLAIGGSLYLLYIINIGGDFMSGRFFSSPLLLAAILLTRLPAIYPVTSATVKYYIIVIAVILLRAFILNTTATTATGVLDAWKLSEAEMSLKNFDWETKHPSGRWVENGLQLKEKGTQLSIQDTSGMLSFYAGYKVHIVDRYGLGDPLLSRLPAENQNEVLIGHFYREVPAGYWLYPGSYGNEIKDENLRKYYEKLSVLIHDENLFSKTRLITIWRMNTGYYDYLLDAYLENNP